MFEEGELVPVMFVQNEVQVCNIYFKRKYLNKRTCARKMEREMLVYPLMNYIHLCITSGQGKGSGYECVNAAGEFQSSHRLAVSKVHIKPGKSPPMKEKAINTVVRSERLMDKEFGYQFGNISLGQQSEPK